MRIIKTPEQKMLEQRLEMEKIADQFEQQEKYNRHSRVHGTGCQALIA